jgi:nucleoside-diphosphate-sugar epimerase
VLITGATGFIGRHLLAALRGLSLDVVAAVREATRLGDEMNHVRATWFDLTRPDGLDPQALTGVVCVYHLAARVHVRHHTLADEPDFLAQNVHATEVLARRAAAAGVRRFVYLSSIKVNGEKTTDRPFRAEDLPNPRDAYGRSKLLAERKLLQIAGTTGMEVVIVRPPLVYGPGVGANFRRLMQWVGSGWPLPLAVPTNRRSLLSVWNLVSLLKHVADHRQAAGRVWLVSDGVDVSTADLLRMIGTSMDRKPILWSLPAPLLRSLGELTGRTPDIERLTHSLQVDISTTRDLLGWRPPISLDKGIYETVRWFRETHRAQ